MPRETKEHKKIDNRLQRARQLADKLVATNGCSQYIALSLATQVVLKTMTEEDAFRLSKEVAAQHDEQ